MSQRAYSRDRVASESNEFGIRGFDSLRNIEKPFVSFTGPQLTAASG